MFNTFSFKAKLLFLCVFMASVSLIISGVSLVGSNRVNSSFKRVTDVAMPNLEVLNSMYLAYKSMRINLLTLTLNGISADQAQHSIATIKEQAEVYKKLDAQYNEIPFQPGEDELYKNVNDSWVKYDKVQQEILSLQAANTPEAKEKLSSLFLKECIETSNVFNQSMDKLKDFHIKAAKTIVGAAESDAANTNQIIILISLAGLCLGLFVGFFFASVVSKSILAIAERLSQNASQVTNSSETIASSSQSLSQSTTEQAASLQQTAASLEEITAMINKASEGANSTATSSKTSQDKAEHGRESVDKMLRSMEEISQSNESILAQINDSNAKMNEIVGVIQEIGTKTKVINEIVFQTKLLSFNASVEAARAGEHGKGFAVVAEEVGSLAQMSGNAAKEITDLLETSVVKVESIVKETKAKVEVLIADGKEKVDSGVSVARDCSEVLNEIVANVSQVSRLSQEISQANKEQSQGVTEINKAMSQLDATTQQNSSVGEQTAASAEELAQQANSLNELVKDLMSVLQGHGAQPNAAFTARPSRTSKPSVSVEKKTKSHASPKARAKGKSVAVKESAALERHSDGFVPRDSEGFEEAS